MHMSSYVPSFSNVTVNVLPEPGYFGFDRSVYGDQRYTTPNKWKWLQELRQQREININAEMM
jgi:hypothetical protein